MRQRLDLEKVETAFNYMDRYAKDVIKEAQVDVITERERTWLKEAS